MSLGLSIAVVLALGTAHAQDAPPAETPPAPDAPAAPEPPPLLKSPELVQFVEAPYPDEAFAQGIEGKVTLLLDVDETGKVTNAQVLVPGGHGFDEAAVAAALQFQFSPAEDANGPVPVQLEFEYGFERRRNRSPPRSRPRPISMASSSRWGRVARSRRSRCPSTVSD